MCVSWLSLMSANTTFLSKATDYFSSHAFAEVRVENMPERKFASARDRTHNHQVMSLNTLTTVPARWRFYDLQHMSFENSGKSRNCSLWGVSPFPTAFSNLLENWAILQCMSFKNTVRKRRHCALRAISPFSTAFSIFLENFVLFSSNLNLSHTMSMNLGRR